MTIAIQRMGNLVHIMADDREAWITEYDSGALYSGDFDLIQKVYLGVRRAAIDLEEDYKTHHQKQFPGYKAAA